MSMEILFVGVVILGLVAFFDIMVGVSNDAVNFLNSSIGSRVAPRTTIMIIASLGIMAGVTFSSGMMEVARSGIFHPQFFTLPELLTIFLAVMITDVILLDLFNTYGLPTSTTVSIVFELLGAAVALSATAASAQQRSSPVRPPSASAPSGSYQQSCRGINMNGNMLSAQCTNSSGAPVFSSLDTNSCRGRDIYNDNGYLRCGSGGGPVPPTPPRPTQPPSGSYQQSCRGISMSGNTLRAQCTNEQGRPVSSSLDLNGCRGKEVYNDNGYLRCGVAAPVRPVPPVPPVGGGGGSFEAIAYTSANFGGRQLRIRDSKL